MTGNKKKSQEATAWEFVDMEKLARLIWLVRWRLPPSRKVHVRPLSLPSIRSHVLTALQIGKEGIMLLFYEATHGLAGDELTHLSIIQREPNL